MKLRHSAAVRKVRAPSCHAAVRHWMTGEKHTSALGARKVFSLATFAHTRLWGGESDVGLRRRPGSL